MIRYRLWIENTARAEIKQLPGHMRQRTRRAVEALVSDPRPHNSQALRPPPGVGMGHLELRRLRIEHWRVVYVVDEEWQEVGVLAVRRRPPYDYGDLRELVMALL